MRSNPRQDRILASQLGNPWGHIFYIGDPDVICLAPHICLSAHTHTHTLRRHNTSLLELCREASRDPDNLSRLASSLVEHLTPDQEDMSLNPRRDKTLTSHLGNPWGQIFYIGDPDLICLARHICLSAHTHTRYGAITLLNCMFNLDLVISFSISLLCQ
jgi:hypothetical protein